MLIRPPAEMKKWGQTSTIDRMMAGKDLVNSRRRVAQIPVHIAVIPCRNKYNGVE
jgi:hypothetical protein